MPLRTTPLSSFVDLLLDAICVVDVEGRFIQVSAASERVFGYTPEEMVGKRMIDMVLPEDRAMTLQAAAEIMAGDPKPHFENRYLRKDGRVVHIMWSARWSEADQVRIAVARDITKCKVIELKQSALYAISEAAHAAEDMPALFRRIHTIIAKLLPAQHFCVAMCDDKTGRLGFPFHVNADGLACQPQQPAADVLCGEVVRGGTTLLLDPEDPSGVHGLLRDIVSDNTRCWLGVPLKTQKGTIGALVLNRANGTPGYNEQDKELLQFVSDQIATAIERKQMHARLRHTAQYDELTDLPNRALLFDRVETALARARRYQGRMSLLYLDLDKFKDVNDVCGHATGDRLLQHVAERLKHCVRDADTVARIGGDEFVILLESTDLPEHASLVAAKINHIVSQCVTIDGFRICIRPSIGMAFYPDHGDSVQQLLKQADDGMYQAKKKAHSPSPLEPGTLAPARNAGARSEV